MAVALGLLRWYSFYALMIADSVKFVIHTGVSAWLLYRALDGYGNQRLMRTISRTSLAAAGMGLITGVIAFGLEQFLPSSLLGYLIVVAVAGGAGMLSFSLLATRLGIEEWHWIRDMVRHRVGL
jgi:hypothetical protein